MTPRRLPLIAILALLFTVIPAHFAMADDVDWAVRTAANSHGAERTSFGYTITPGQSVEDAMVVANRGAAPVTLTVYAADGFTSDSGGYDVQLADSEAQGVGRWVSVANTQITVDPQQMVTVPFTVTVPQTATPGDYAGGVITSMVTEGDGAGVSVDRRLGLRMQVRVDGELKPSLAVKDVHVDWKGGLNPFAAGQAGVSYTVTNTGNTIVGGQGSADLSGPFGWLPASAQASEAMPALLPGESWTQHIDVSGVYPLLLLTGKTTVIPTTTDAAGSTAALAAVSADAMTWAVPWTLLGVLLVLVAIAVAAPKIIRRWRANQRQREDQRVAAAVEAALGEAQ